MSAWGKDAEEEKDGEEEEDAEKEKKMVLEENKGEKKDKPRFSVGDKVHAFFMDEWREGVIVTHSSSSSSFSLLFRCNSDKDQR